MRGLVLQVRQNNVDTASLQPNPSRRSLSRPRLQWLACQAHSRCRPPFLGPCRPPHRMLPTAPQPAVPDDQPRCRCASIPYVWWCHVAPLARLQGVLRWVWWRQPCRQPCRKCGRCRSLYASMVSGSPPPMGSCNHTRAVLLFALHFVQAVHQCTSLHAHSAHSTRVVRHHTRPCCTQCARMLWRRRQGAWDLSVHMYVHNPHQ